MTKSLHERVLVLLAGPVGAGKSTTAAAVVQRLRSRGVGAATIDLDQVYCMARQGAGFGDEEVWTVARQAAAAMSDVFFSTVAAVVVVEGGFHDAGEIDDVVANLDTDARLEVIALQLSFEQTLGRVMADPDPGRVASRNRQFLRQLHDQFVAALPYLGTRGVVIEAGLGSIDDVAQVIVERIL